MGKHRALIFKSLILLWLFFLFSCSSKKEGSSDSEVPTLPIITVQQKDTVMETDYVSDIQAVKNVEIRSRVAGFLEQIFVDEGKEVRKGQPLFQINDLEFKTELAKAKANVSNANAEAKAAELEVDRTKILVDKNIISKTEYDLAIAKLKAAKAKIEEALSSQKSAETKLSYTFIRAPFDGVIDRIPFKTGSVIDAGALLTTLSDIKQVYAYFHISENEYLQYKKSLTKGPQQNKPLQLILADGSVYPQMGTIQTIDGEFNDNTGAISFRAMFPNPSKLLRHGASGKVRLISAINNAVIIPQKAVFEIQDKNYVFIVGNDEKVTMRSFIAKRRIAQYYIVDNGLLPGEKIVLEGVQGIREGTKINPVIVNADSMMRNSFSLN
jgi:RND family efflux transporter MFP subunit